MSDLTTVIESSGGLVTGLDVTASGHERLQVDVTAAARDAAHADEIVEAMRAVHGVEIAKVSDRTFLMHLGGKLSIESKVPIRNRDDMSMVYTPGVARVCMAIAANPADARRLTIKRNTIAVVTDGSAVLGLGNIGPLAAMPVMEGKAALFKRFGGIDAFPICLDTQDVDEIVAVVKAIAPVFAGINLEDISAPRCFEIEARLRAELDLPVFHDDQHGTAIVVLAALRNALRVVGKDLSEVRIVQSGAGAAGTAVLKLLMKAGATDIVVADRRGAIHSARRRVTRALDMKSAKSPFITNCARTIIRSRPSQFSPDGYFCFRSMPQNLSPHQLPSIRSSSPVATSFSARSGFCMNFAVTTLSMTSSLISFQSGRTSIARPRLLAIPGVSDCRIHSATSPEVVLPAWNRCSADGQDTPFHKIGAGGPIRRLPWKGQKLDRKACSSLNSVIMGLLSGEAAQRRIYAETDARLTLP